MEEEFRCHDTNEVRHQVDVVTLLPLSLDCEKHQTYIVQFQKDQVYRVPSYENALLIERDRNSPSATNKERQCCPHILLTIALILLGIVIIIAITMTILYFIFTPNTKPTFSISNFVVINPIDKISQPHYLISLMAKNPNKRLGIEYQKDANVLLLFEKTKVAIGKFPRLELNPNDSNKVMVDLIGTNGPFPHSMKTNMNDRKYNTLVPMDLEMKINVKTKASHLGTWVEKCNVGCMFKVRILKNETRVISQECQTNFKQS
ncbi:hypothetical protein TanjilG_16756 [Lupinus angustifolius]|uniref:Late embryogenesis abundant protein LEA-2 subgroup domain-containing protein n=1 Tax=Lupinus angustifolius TaxID=3871 RepID=A0A4P1R089_LUPAN|nr:PREDICTED: uncharacterized protein LOC109326308 [Lupinus angustifolius]OIV98429.1 hypothetical protein TanjilG_16756 [Lupinus angustifolius]